jgi:hypothetical protein
VRLNGCGEMWIELVSVMLKLMLMVAKCADTNRLFGFKPHCIAYRAV